MIQSNLRLILVIATFGASSLCLTGKVQVLNFDSDQKWGDTIRSIESIATRPRVVVNGVLVVFPPASLYSPIYPVPVDAPELEPIVFTLDHEPEVSLPEKQLDLWLSHNEIERVFLEIDPRVETYEVLKLLLYFHSKKVDADISAIIEDTKKVSDVRIRIIADRPDPETRKAVRNYLKGKKEAK